MLVRRSVGDRVRKLLGRSEANVCSQEVPVPITSEGQTPIKVYPEFALVGELDSRAESISRLGNRDVL
jgi:hypothetical protein